MTYELAKEMKDAGFKRKHDPTGTNSIENIMDADLSELIKACRPLTFRIFVNGDTGKAAVDFPLTGLEQVTWYADIDEAVARFWLSNKHE